MNFRVFKKAGAPSPRRNRTLLTRPIHWLPQDGAGG